MFGLPRENQHYPVFVLSLYCTDGSNLLGYNRECALHFKALDPGAVESVKEGKGGGFINGDSFLKSIGG